MAEGGTEPKSNDNQVSKLQLEVNECLGNWLVYLQVRAQVAIIVTLENVESNCNF